MTKRSKKTRISNADLANYLECLLGTTLVLDDGTRIKSVILEWRALTDEQRTSAVEAIRHAAVQELKKLSSRSRLRFEFNEIPEDLEAMLNSLGGSESPDFEWAEVHPAKGSTR